MFSVDNFYYILYTNILRNTKPLGVHAFHFQPFGSTGNENLTEDFAWDRQLVSRHRHLVLFYDQEPIFLDVFNRLNDQSLLRNKNCRLLANSEHSDVKKLICKENNLIDWYYFFHGFAALDWYKDYQYLPLVEKQFTKVFMSLNRLVTKDRSYRLQLVGEMLARNICDQGIVSLDLEDRGHGVWLDEITKPHSKLSLAGKKIVYNNIRPLAGSLIADKQDPTGDLSAKVGLDEVLYMKSALFHVVSETVFFHPKLHLTEKVFKPIVVKRPFILVAAPGNLAYLKSYGFQTFDRWIDESYDQEPDNDRRIAMIATELEKLCSKSNSELQAMHAEMQEVLDYNFLHFYGKFKEIIVDEMLTNFQNALHQWNHARIDGRFVRANHIDFASIRAMLVN
jgi:hypothetical protein